MQEHHLVVAQHEEHACNPAGRGVRADLVETLRAVQPQFTANSIAALKAYALAGLGVAIVPELTVGDAPGDQGLTSIEIIGAERTDTRMCLCRRQSRLLGNAARRLLNDFVAAFSPHPA